MPIDVSCSCGKTFSVPDHFAGRRGRCKGCGSPVAVPIPALIPAAVDDYDVTVLDDGPDDGQGVPPIVTSEEEEGEAIASGRSSLLGRPVNSVDWVSTQRIL